MTNSSRFLMASTLLVACLIVTRPVLAGTPLLCHPFDIGDARSLPWGNSDDWSAGRADYIVSQLVADTEALLTPSMPTLVRMETMRRAAIYSSRDNAVAKELLMTLTRRAERSKIDGKSDALALFDAIYIKATLRELARVHRGLSNLPRLHETDAYIDQALALRPDDGAMHLGASLMSWIMSGGRRTDASRLHADLARAAARTDPLLARNVWLVN